jgi:hypothetical protein
MDRVWHKIHFRSQTVTIHLKRSKAILAISFYPDLMRISPEFWSRPYFEHAEYSAGEISSNSSRKIKFRKILGNLK